MTFHQPTPAGRPCVSPTDTRPVDLGPGGPARLTRTLARRELAERQAPFGSCRLSLIYVECYIAQQTVRPAT